MKTYIYENEETLIEVNAMAKSIALESREIEYEECSIKYDDVKGLKYRDTYNDIKPFSDHINGTAFFKTDNEGNRKYLYRLG